MAAASRDPFLEPGRLRRWTAGSFLLAAVLFQFAFLQTFDWHEPQWTDATWFAALASWVGAVLASSPRATEPLPWRRADFAPLVLLLLVFAACWLPFYDNWRWAFTGDGFGIYSVGYWFGKDGPIDSILSVRGIDNFYTRLWEVSYNWLMYVAEPTLWWHRVGQLLMALLALAAIHMFYTLVVGRWWAAAIVLATATNYVFVWISYISYQRTDSFVFYHLTLAGAVLLWRMPERLGGWLLCGLAGGLSLSFTPVVWGAVAWVGLIFGSIALLRGRIAALVVYAVSFALAATPILLEIPWLLEMLQTQSVARAAGDQQVLPSAAYLWSIFAAIVMAPWDSHIYELGAAGAFLRFPLGHLYLAGLVVAAAAILPGVRRTARIPAAAPLLLGLLLSDALLFALTNKGYGLPSHKRFYNLVPLQIFFAILPLYVLAQWTAARDRLRVVPIVAAASIACAAWIGLTLIQNPRPHTYGHNVFDGLIEMRQRYPERRIVLLTTRPLGEDLAPDGLLNLTYGIGGEHLRLAAKLDTRGLGTLCSDQVLFCHEVQHVGETANALLAADTRWRPVEVLNSFEIRCARCVP